MSKTLHILNQLFLHNQLINYIQMKFKIGDYVRFLNERQEGVVTRIIDHQLIGVTIEDDFEITVLATELVIVSSSETQLLDTEVSIEDFAPIKSLTEQGVFLAWIRNEKATSVFTIHLINQTDYQLLFSCSTEESGQYNGLCSGTIEPKKSISLATYPADTITLWPTFHLQCVYHRNKLFNPKQPLITQYTIKPKSIFGTEKVVPQLLVNGFYAALDNPEISIDIERLRDSIGTVKSPSNSPIFVPQQEVDLHIEELKEEHSTMPAGEILQFQLAHFNRCLDSAIAHNFERIIFIHGLGNGTLRYEIHKKLSNHPNVRTYKDARKEKFGYGATEVLLK